MSWYQHRRRTSGTSGGLLRARPGDAARHIKAACTALAVAASLALGTAAAGERDVWGYGVRGCDAYLEALANADTGDAAELQRYEDWLTGFVSALNLALGEDVLRGSGLTAALRGTREYCRANGGQDFFNAAMDHVRGLSSLR